MRGCLNRLGLWVVVLWVMSLAVAPCLARQFTNQEGKTIEAKVVGVSATHVRLNKSGRLFTLPLDQLCEADQVYLDLLRQEMQKKRKLAEALANKKKAPAELKPSGDDQAPGDFDHLINQKPQKGSKPAAEVAVVEKDPSLPVAPGKISDPIKVTVPPNSKCSYLLYLPPTFKKESPVSVIFIAAPHGGRRRDVELFKDGADFNDMMVAVRARLQESNGPER